MHLNPTWLQTSSSLSVFPGFQSRLCRCWRAGGCGRSSSSLCSWTRRTGRARAADRASTSWSMSSRGEPVSSSLTSTLTGSKSSRWMCDESRSGQKNTSPRHSEEIMARSLWLPFTRHWSFDHKKHQFKSENIVIYANSLMPVCITRARSVCAFK